MSSADDTRRPVESDELIGDRSAQHRRPEGAGLPGGDTSLPGTGASGSLDTPSVGNDFGGDRSGDLGGDRAGKLGGESGGALGGGRPVAHPVDGSRETPADAPATGGGSDSVADAAAEAERALAQAARDAEQAVRDAHSDGTQAVEQGFADAQRATERAYEEAAAKNDRLG